MIGHSWSEFIERYALAILLALVFVFFAFEPDTPQFATTANLKTILSNQAVLGILVVATVIPLVAGHIDLSVGPAAGLASVICAGMMSESGLPLVPAILIAIGCGLAIGVFNGLMVAGIGINSIVATLGTSSIIAAIVLWYTEGITITGGISTDLRSIGSGDWLGLPKPFWFFAVIAAVVWYVLEHTPIGRYLYSVGASPKAAELVGLRVRRFAFFTFVCSGGLAAAAGVLLVAIQGGGNPQLGQNFVLPALAAVFLGATSIKPGRYNVIGSVVAIFLLAISVNGLTLLGAEPWVNEMFNGVALLVGVGVSVYSGKRRQRSSPDAAGPPAASEPADIAADEAAQA